MKTLELYRASAGSGKTYTLAKKYLWYYLTIRLEEGKTRFRTPAELADSARHILAITFTNKATNEMQVRIVDSLYDLAYSELVYATDRNGRRVIKKPAYMQDFIDELGVAKEEISKVAAEALGLLLENYSEFNVSTIDSFFQQVLRTFAYESEINDSYQVELDTEFLSEVGVDATLQEIDNNADDERTKFWIKTIMDRTEKGKWNIFSRSRSEHGENPYMTFIRSVKKMETEQYKLIREDIENYFETHDNGSEFLRLYRDLKITYEEPVRQAFNRYAKACHRMGAWLPPELADAKLQSKLYRLKMIANSCSGDVFKWDTVPVKKPAEYISMELLQEKQIADWIARNPEGGRRLTDLFGEVCAAFDLWCRLVSGPEFRHFCLYSTNLPYYALFGVVNRKRREYLDESNAIELAETSMILRGVIGESDAPFVYERLGTRLNHFLIDEFQDTSRMQWENLSPLLHESMSRGNGNLIIGDAKQSIYRFRNADPSLITSVVPAEFGEAVLPRGLQLSENTNYRSDLHIVQFNNSFFKYLASQIDQNYAPDEGRMSFSDLYANVVQTPDKTTDAGYVEIHLANQSKSKFSEETLSQVPRLVESLLKRGYLQKEICVLVSLNEEAADISAAFVRYNREEAGDNPQIRFVSEQSLKVASSRAVDIIIGVLQNMARGHNPTIRHGDERRKKGVATARDILANFKFYQLQHSGMSVPEQLDSYFENIGDYNALSELLGEMQSLAIPALVEAVTAAFLDENIVKSDAIYLAAFQDIVLEYCESHPTDIGSFLKWWERKSRSASISSPEGSDAVQIVTVHKSKGLQYECVIVPFAEWEMTDKLPKVSKAEWLWVEPQVISHPTIEMPPYLPVATSGLLKGTSHESLLNRYFDQSKMDRVNAAYVAFTRAKNELYIFSTASNAGNENSDAKKGKGERGASGEGIGNYLFDFFQQLPDASGVTSDPESPSPLLSSDEVEISSDPVIIRVGNPPLEVGAGRKASASVSVLHSYESHRTPDFLKYRESTLPPVMDEDDVAADMEDLDPRSEGNIKHAVLELVRAADDLPRAVRHLCLSGLIPEGMAPSIESSLAEAIASPDVSRWFDGSAKVYNERSLLKGGLSTKRPDRLLVFEDGHAEVIDYKFGKNTESAKYRRQVKGYMDRLRETGLFTSVKGFLWYVNEGDICEVKE